MNAWQITKIKDEKCNKCNGQQTCFLVQQGYADADDQTRKFLCNRQQLLSLLKRDELIDQINITGGDPDEIYIKEYGLNWGLLYNKSRYPGIADFNILEKDI